MKKLLNFFAFNRKTSILLLVISIPVILSMRFNSQDIFFIRPFVGKGVGVLTPDMENYVEMINYFRGTGDISKVVVPFSFRPFVTYLASLLPFEAFTSLNIITSLCVSLTVLVIFLIIKKLKFNFEYCVLGSFLYLFSFPTFYYGSAGYIDASLVLFLSIIVYLRVSERDYLLPIAFILGTLAKETIIIAFPFVFLDIFFRNSNYRKKQYFFGFLSIVCCLICSYFVRKQFSSSPSFINEPLIDNFLFHLIRPKSHGSFLLTFGIPGFLSLWYLFKRFNFQKDKLQLSFLVGAVSSVVLFCYAFLSAYPDGRFVWTAYPFLIPFVIYYIESYYSKGLKTQTE